MLEWMVSSSMLIAVVLAVRALGKNRLSCRARYALWLAVLVRLLVPAQLFTLPWSVANAVPELPGTLTGERIYILPLERAEVSFPDQIIDGEAAPQKDVTFRDPYAGYWFGCSRPSEDGRTFTRYADKAGAADILRSVWLAGAAAVLLAVLISNARFERRLRRTREPFDALTGGAKVYVADGLASPCLVGLLRPAVYLTPESLSDGTRLRHILAHETTHRLHGDHVWSHLRVLALALHWYNPLVWLAAILSKRDGELACDESTIARLGEDERVPYGETLLALVTAKPLARDLISCSTSMTGGKRTIRERIETIARHPRTVGVVLLAAVAALSVATVTAFGKAAPETGGDKASGWLRSDDAVLSYVMRNYVVDGKKIVSGRYETSGASGEDGLGYKSFTVYAEDGSAYYLTANGIWRVTRFFGKTRVGPELRVTGVDYRLKAPNGSRLSAQETLDVLEAGVEWSRGNVSFTLPEGYEPVENWHGLRISGVERAADGTYRTIRFYEGEDWRAGVRYTIGLHSGMTELTLTAELPAGDGETLARTIDLLRGIELTEPVILRVTDLYRVAARRWDGDGWSVCVPEEGWRETSSGGIARWTSDAGSTLSVRWLASRDDCDLAPYMEHWDRASGTVSTLAYEDVLNHVRMEANLYAAPGGGYWQVLTCCDTNLLLLSGYTGLEPELLAAMAESFCVRAPQDILDLVESVQSNAEASGVGGPDSTWHYRNHALVIGGTGPMTRWSKYMDFQPYADLMDKIYWAVVGDGITALDGSTFYGCTNLESVIFEGSAPDIVYGDAVVPFSDFDLPDGVTIYYSGDSFDGYIAECPQHNWVRR